MAPYKLSLRPGEYEKDLTALRGEVAKDRSGFFDVQPLLPYPTKEIHLQLRGKDLYIIGFYGKGGWYDLDGEEGGWGKGSCGKGSCGVKGNYNNLPKVDTINVTPNEPVVTHERVSVLNLENLLYFKKGGKELDAKLIVVAAAVVSESLRFRPVAEQFTSLFNLELAEVPLIDLKDRYFVNWDLLSQSNNSDVLLKKLPKEPSASVASSSKRSRK